MYPHRSTLLTLWSLLFTTLTAPLQAQTQCVEQLNFRPVTQLNRIEWQKFPEFKLPFTIIYDGPRLGEAPFSPLKRGFSHIASITLDEQASSPGSIRAKGFYGVAFGLNQPWETIESPWNNDMDAYRAKWDRWLNEFSGGQRDAQGRYKLPAGFFMLDIERMHETDERILRIKNNPLVPEQYRRLPDAEFIRQYKKDMTALYAESMRFVREKADMTNIPLTTYADVPIRNTWLNVVGNSWQDWSTNPDRVSYLVKDPATNRIGGPFYEQMDVIAPSIYYYNDYPSPLAGDYLAYMLFQIDANRAWSNKPIIPFAWMRYHDCCGSFPKFIQPHMAEATAIFPFFAGAKGLWLWEHGNFRTNDAPMAAYEYFIHGLYRLSQVADMFEGDYQLVIDKPARDHMDEQSPVWRGVYKDKKLLIAAQNPYAAEGQSTTLTVRFQSWSKDITLKGKEVYLCKFDLGAEGFEADALSGLTIFPNPSAARTAVEFYAESPRTVQLQLFTLTGQAVLSQSLEAVKGRNLTELQTIPLPAGSYIVQITDGQIRLSKRLLIGR